MTRSSKLEKHTTIAFIAECDFTINVPVPSQIIIFPCFALLLLLLLLMWLPLLLFRTTYAKVAGKYQDVLTLESSVAELHQMFLDFALLTEQQGELLDQIEFQVKQAGDYIEDANVDVHEAIQYQSSIRKKQW